MIRFIRFIVQAGMHVFVGVLLVAAWFNLRAVIRSGIGQIGGDLWPEMTVTVRRSNSPVGFWLYVIFFAGLIFAVLVLVAASMLYYDIMGTEYRPPWFK
jgi:hypothetical protein